MHELQQVLCSCEDEMSWCHDKRSAVADEDALIREKHTTFGKTKCNVLYLSATRV